MLPFPEGWASEEQVNSMPSPCPQIKGQIINRLSVWHAYTHVGTYGLDATCGYTTGRKSLTHLNHEP